MRSATLCQLLLVVITDGAPQLPSLNHALLVVSLDGFLPSYLSPSNSPYLWWLRSEGTYSPYLYNVFPTKTFPNHHSIVTGVYVETHGVLSKDMYNQQERKFIPKADIFTYSKDIVPIWTLHQQNGHHSGVMMWPAANVSFNGTTPTFVMDHMLEVPWNERINKIIKWMTDPLTPSDLVFLYLEEPDRHSHVFGPQSPQVMEQVHRVDITIRYLFDRLKDSNLIDRTDILLLSDHGMEEVTLDRVIDLHSYLNMFNVLTIDRSPVIQLFPESDNIDEVYQVLNSMSHTMNFSVYRKADIPERWHFQHNKRTSPLLLVAHSGYGFQDLYDSEQYYRKKWNLNASHKMTFGLHGYDPEDPKMHPFFMAIGPRIKKKHTVAPFHTIDLFPLMCHMLQLEAPITNGSLENVISILRNFSHRLNFDVWLISPVTVLLMMSMLPL